MSADLIMSRVEINGPRHIWRPIRLSYHSSVLHVQGIGAARPGWRRHRREKVCRVRAAVACQQSHLVVVLGRG
ncbi:hypothetical protein GOODEAATRI_016499 [Goodea atripinnis]|uniref:Uncharacterized protein n=1 Tax=Goodea atripinnis TaxID=208336 RepID=A0ABV0PEM5_9TELE